MDGITTGGYTAIGEGLRSFRDAVAYVQGEREQTLCENAFRAYFSAQGIEKLDEKTLPEMMRMFDERPYREMEITAQQAVDYVTDIKRNIASYQNVMDRVLTNARSRAVLEQLIIARLTLDTSRMARLTLPHKSEYFDPTFFQFAPGSVYVDCGGYTGDTVLEYLLTCPDCERIHMLEPSHDVMRRAKERLEPFCENESIVFHEAAAGDFACDVAFNENTQSGDGAVSSDATPVKVRQVALDTLIEGRVSMIKMDIEGAELCALQGAKNLIQRWHPDLAICVYHKPGDLWELIEYIDSLGCGYEYDLRHFGGAHFFDTVLLCRSTDPRHLCDAEVDQALVADRLQKILRLSAIYDDEKATFLQKMENYRAELLREVARQINLVRNRDQRLGQLETTIEKQAEETDQLQATVTKQADEACQYQATIARQTEEADQLRAAIRKREDEARQYQATIARQTEEADRLQATISEQAEEADHLRETVIRQKNEAGSFYQKCADIVAARQRQARGLEIALEDRNREIAQMRVSAQATEMTLEAKSQTVDYLMGVVEFKDQTIANYQDIVVDKERTIEYLQSHIDARDRTIAELQAKISDQEAELARVGAELARVQGQYDLIVHSGTYRLMGPVRRVLRLLRRG